MSRNRRLLRIRIIRRRVAATALVIFLLAFGTIAATGSMGATHKASSTQQRRTTTTSPRTTTSDQSSQDQSGYAPVTTRQS